MSKSRANLNNGKDYQTGLSTRKTLLAATRELIDERGDVQFSLSDIAKASGKNSALVSYYFGGKEQLLHATLNESLDSMLGALVELQHKDLPADEKLKLHLLGMIKVNSKNTHLSVLSRVLLRRSSDDTAKKIAARFLVPIIDFQKSVLEQGRSEGLFREVDPFTFYITSIGAIDMLFAANATIRYGFGQKKLRKKDIDQFGDELCRTLISGITAR